MGLLGLEEVELIALGEIEEAEIGRALGTFGRERGGGTQRQPIAGQRGRDAGDQPLCWTRGGAGGGGGERT